MIRRIAYTDPEWFAFEILYSERFIRGLEIKEIKNYKN
jgi:hypothetical protein